MTANLEPGQDPIRHVVALILENHSFDQMLGCFRQIHPKLDGIDPANLRWNEDDQGRRFTQKATTERMMLLDPHHEVNHVAVQLAGHNGGFVRDLKQSYPQDDGTGCQDVMGYYPLDYLPALHALARDFTICDRWFSSLPGPTWPNRFFALTGTSNGRVNMPNDGEHTVDLAGWFQQDQTTLFDRLNERGIRWKVYFHDIPQTSVLLHQRMPHNTARYFYIDELFDDARGAEPDFPQFALIEPDYMGAEENDDHPPHDIMKAEKLVADVYNAIRANQKLWESTLLLVFFDEHGGFYDHVEPPAAIPPDDHREEYGFDQFGLRVPALLVSPWARRGVVSTQFDHTSVLKYLIGKWQLGPLGRRAANPTTNSIGGALADAMRQDSDTIRRIELSAAELAPVDLDAEERSWGIETSHHRALQAFKDFLRIETVENLPHLYSWCARLIERLKTGAEWGLGRLYREPEQYWVSITELDRLARLPKRISSLREDFARFLMHQKRQSPAALAQRIRNLELPEAVRDQAVHTLSLVTNRRFSRTKRPAFHADAWLKARGE